MTQNSYIVYVYNICICRLQFKADEKHKQYKALLIDTNKDYTLQQSRNFVRNEKYQLTDTIIVQVSFMV